MKENEIYLLEFSSSKKQPSIFFTDFGNSSAKLFKLFKLISYFQEFFEPEF